MKVFRKVFLSRLCLCIGMSTAVHVQAQSVGELIANHVEAMGGKEKLLSVHSLYQESTAVLSNGAEVNTKTWKVKGKLFRQEIDFGTGAIIIIVTPTKGWSRNPRNGSSFLPMPEDVVKRIQIQMDPSDPFADYVAQGYKVEAAGKDTVSGSVCTRLKLTFPSGQTSFFSIDDKTFFIDRESHKGGLPGGVPDRTGNGRQSRGEGEISTDFSYFRPTPNGFLFPYTILAGAFGAKNSVTTLDVNKFVDIETLSQPK